VRWAGGRMGGGSEGLETMRQREKNDIA
jgi:hypothetical protein